MTTFSLTSFLKRVGWRENVVALIANTSTFVPKDRSECPYYVVSVIRCAFGAQLDLGASDQPTTQGFVLNPKSLQGFSRVFPQVINPIALCKGEKVCVERKENRLYSRRDKYRMEILRLCKDFPSMGEKSFFD